VNLEEIKHLIAVLEESKLNKLRIKNGDFELLLEKEVRMAPLPVQHAEKQIEKHEVKIEEVSSNWKYVTSPMVGTFYSSPSPNDPHFVKVGDRVNPDTVICIIEAMKVMNEVKAGVAGVIKEVMCKNAQPVEFGTKLFKIEPV
jgi:acetyl-CoA carboxylase biotin carboxyl carrier protein